MERKFSDSRESGKSSNHNACLAGAVVASWSRTQVVAGSDPFTTCIMTNILVKILEKSFSVKTFRKNSNVLRA